MGKFKHIRQGSLSLNVDAADVHHKHSAKDIESGVLEDSRIPELNASKIAKGTITRPFDIETKSVFHNVKTDLEAIGQTHVPSGITSYNNVTTEEIKLTDGIDIKDSKGHVVGGVYTETYANGETRQVIRTRNFTEGGDYLENEFYVGVTKKDKLTYGCSDKLSFRNAFGINLPTLGIKNGEVKLKLSSSYKTVKEVTFKGPVFKGTPQVFLQLDYEVEDNKDNAIAIGSLSVLTQNRSSTSFELAIYNSTISGGTSIKVSWMAVGEVE